MRQHGLFGVVSLCLLLSTSVPQAAAAPADSKIVGVVALTVRREGITPQRVTVPSGRILLRISNRIGLGDLGVDLSQETGERVKPIAMRRGKGRFLEPILLAPGNYVVRVSGYPALSATITVTSGH